jgi:tetratricopeptide (TPR) repeat protein
MAGVEPDSAGGGEHDSRSMVYRSAMTPTLAALLLLAADPPAGAEAPAAAPEAATTQAPAAAAEAPAATANPPAAAPTAPKPAARQPATILAQDPRMEAYSEFKALYETAHFEEALPLAKRVVELSDTGSDRDYELPIAYNNLGATQYQLGDYAAAEASYRASLEILEATQGISSRRMIVPLAGLGAVFAAQDQHALAAELFDRALAVSRRADGLFNLAQLPLIDQVADSRYAIADYQAVERERMYELKIAEQNFGYQDERTLPAVLKLADLYEGLKEYIAARLMYLRARDIAMKEGRYSPAAVRSLVGIARTHRLQYTIEPETLESQQAARDDVTGEIIAKVYRESRVPPPSADSSGLKAAQTALELLRSTADPPRELLTLTLVELGDWYQATSRPQLALPYYTEAAGIYAADQDAVLGNPLSVPRMVFYRAPSASTRGLNTTTGAYIVRKAVFEFAVSETGETQDVAVVLTDMSEGQVSQSRRAISRAIYSPRFADGQAVRTEGVRFTADWYEQHELPDPAATPAAAGGDAPQPEQAPEPPASAPGS